MGGIYQTGKIQTMLNMLSPAENVQKSISKTFLW